MRKRNRVTMPRWPAWILFGTAAACAVPAVTTPAAVEEHYEALGQEPGWRLSIRDERIDYTGNYGDVRITAARPTPRTTANGRRYETPELIVDIVYARCNDAMSGFGYEHRVAVTAIGQTYRGCGGARRTDWDG